MKAKACIPAIFTLALTLLLSACGKKYPQPDTVHVADVHHIMAQYGRVDSLTRQSLIGNDSAEVLAFMKVVGELPTTSERIYAWSWSLPVMRFTPLVDSVYRNGTDSIALAIGNIQARMREQGLSLTPRRYGAVVWGNLEQIIFVDSVMLIALNHYLGAENDAYSSFPLYSRLVKEPRLMPYDMAEAIIATDYPYENDGGTLLSRMLYEGALTVAKMEAVDKSNILDALAYRPEQYQFITDNEADLWHTLITSDLLFDTSSANIDRLISPAPNTPLLDRRCPGRVGRYFGYRIVDSYIKRHPKITLAELLSPQFYTNPDILAESRYNPGF